MDLYAVRAVAPAEADDDALVAAAERFEGELPQGLGLDDAYGFEAWCGAGAPRRCHRV